MDDDDDYDPHEHREVQKPTNYFESLMHLLKCSIGTGILAMPQAFSRTGFVTGSILTFVIGMIIVHGLRLLVDCQYELCKRRKVGLLSYPLSMQAAFEEGSKCGRKLAPAAPCITDFFLVLYQLGICCVYIVFIGASTKKMLDPYMVLDVKLHMLFCLLPLILLNCIPNLKLLAPVSIFANALILVAVIIVIILLFTEKRNEGPLDLWGDPTTLPLFFGTILFALTAVGVVVAIENNMKVPSDFGKPLGVLNVGMLIVMALYVAMGMIGHNFCRTDCRDSITLNFDQKSIGVKIVSAMYVVAITCSYALHCYVPVEVIWRGYVMPCIHKPPDNPSTHLCLWEYLTRILICLFTFGIAVAVPKLGAIISLAGALCLSMLGLIFPGIMEICVSYPSDFGPMKIKLLKDIFLIIFGFTGMCTGSYFALAEMFK